MPLQPTSSYTVLVPMVSEDGGPGSSVPEARQFRIRFFKTHQDSQTGLGDAMLACCLLERRSSLTALPLL